MTQNILKLYYFSAQWCGNCKLTHPEVESVSNELGIKLIEIDCGGKDSDEIIDLYNIMSLPTIILKKGDDEVYRSSGVKNKVSIMEDIREFI